MPGVHAVLSASAAKRWLSCPPSGRLCQKLKERFGEESSPFAAEGTLAHAVAELKLRRENGELNGFLFEQELKALGPISSEIDRYTDIYVDVVLEKYYEARKRCPDARLLIEQRLDFSPWVRDGFGTGDALIISDQTLEVIDLKYGKGVPVYAEGNPQARLYGLGALNEFGDLYGFELVRTTIVQPRLESITSETLKRDELLAWGEEIKPIADMAWRGEGEYSAGEHCRFCTARAICKARALKAMDLFQYGFDSPDLIPDEEIPGILKVVDTAEAWLKDIKAYALAQALAGADIRGYKLVHGRRPGRVWTDEDVVLDTLAKAGFTKEQYMTTPSFRSPSDLEKTIGRTAFKSLVGQFTRQGEGALTLVPEDDPRPAANNADNEFADMVQG